MSDFERMCKCLNKKHIVDCERYKYTEEEVKKYIKQSKKDRILNLKCEAREKSFVEHFSVLTSGMAFFISILALFDNLGKISKFLYIVPCIVAIIFLVYFCVKYSSIFKWRDYILTAIKEIEKEM